MGFHLDLTRGARRIAQLIKGGGDEAEAALSDILQSALTTMVMAHTRTPL
jgi:hypothetical protein